MASQFTETEPGTLTDGGINLSPAERDQARQCYEAQRAEAEEILVSISVF